MGFWNELGELTGFNAVFGSWDEDEPRRPAIKRRHYTTERENVTEPEDEKKIVAQSEIDRVNKLMREQEVRLKELKGQLARVEAERDRYRKALQVFIAEEEDEETPVRNDDEPR